MKIKQWLQQDFKETKTLLKSIPALIMVVFVLSIVLMNLLANKSINTGVDWLALDCGIVISWGAFLSMDIIVKHFGVKASNKLSILAILINLIVSAIFIIVANIGGVWAVANGENENIINSALNNTISSQWYVLIGSTVAFVVSALTNNFINYLIGKTFKNKPNSFVAYATRSYVSTFIAQIVDNLIFALIVSINFFGWSFIQCLTCAVTGAVVELICEIIFSPIGYKITERWRKDNIGNDYLQLLKTYN